MDVARELSGKLVREFEGSADWIRDSSEGKTGVKVINSITDISNPPPLDYDPLDPDSPDWCQKIQVIPRIARVEPLGRIVLEDGRVLNNIDVIIFGTGYLYSFPFLDQASEPFKSYPLISQPSRTSATEDFNLKKWIQEKQNGQTFKPIARTAPSMSNLDDWQLFHRTDSSLLFWVHLYELYPSLWLKVRRGESQRLALPDSAPMILSY